MSSNTPEIEKSIGRYRFPSSAPAVRSYASDYDGTDRASETCRKDNCDQPVETTIVQRNGDSVEIKRCAKGHFQRKRTLDTDGEAYRTFSAILGP